MLELSIESIIGIRVKQIAGKKKVILSAYILHCKSLQMEEGLQIESFHVIRPKLLESADLPSLIILSRARGGGSPVNPLYHPTRQTNPLAC